jgi:hypothetical protein
MKTQRFNWQIWAGLLVSLAAFISYFLIFVRFPATRDFPWANLLLFVIAAVLLVVGIRRAFAPDRGRWSKVLASVLATVIVLVLAFFVFSIFIAARWLPASSAAPKLGQKAPDFNLLDTSGRPVALSELLSTPINGSAPKGVLLIFYRGYW